MGIESEQLELEKVAEKKWALIASYGIVFVLVIGLVSESVLVFEFAFVFDFDFAPVLETVQWNSTHDPVHDLVLGKDSVEQWLLGWLRLRK